MLSPLHLYLRFLGVSIQSQMQYRVSFMLLTLGHFAATAIEFLAILVLFDRFGALDEWSLPEVAFFYGVANIAFSIADAAAYGFDRFGDMVKSGDFDRLLLRPRSTALQLAGQELTLRRVGRLAQGLAILLWASAALDLGWTPAKVALLLGATAGGATILLLSDGAPTVGVTDPRQIVKDVKTRNGALVLQCDPGFCDLDGDIDNGCEWVIVPEVCDDGIDDDCDGLIDGDDPDCP